MGMRRWLGGLAMVGIVALSVVNGSRTEAQSLDGTAAKEALFKTIKAQDAALFKAYNTCDLKTLGAIVTDDLEFYHDVTGLAVGRQVFVDAIKENICGKVTRELVEETLEVHPLNGYGAVEIGTHWFLHPWTQDHGVVGEARFVMLWQLKDGNWEVARVISYEHRLAK
jgi:hypothetical protein